MALAAIIVLMIGRAVCAQHALPGQPGGTPAWQSPARAARYDVAPATPAYPPATPDADPHWRERFNPLRPIVRGLRPEDAAAAQPVMPLPISTAAFAAATPVAPVPIEVRGMYAQHWQEGESEVYLLRGACVLESEVEVVSGEQLVLWRTPAGQGFWQVTVYVEGDVTVTRDGRRESLPPVWREVRTGPFPIKAGSPVELDGQPDDPVYRKAAAQRGVATVQRAGAPVLPVQYVAQNPGGPLLAPPVDAAPPGVDPSVPTETMPFISPPLPSNNTIRHVSIYPRSLGEGFSLQTVPSQNTVPPEYVTTITGGVRIVVDGVPVDLDGQMVLSTIDLAADRVVIWTDADRVNEFSTNFDLGGDTPFEVYLEGDIVMRQGTTVVRAERAFYNLAEERGLFSETEVRGYLPQFETIVRLRAQELRQLSHNKFHAQQGWISTSDMGIPGYRFEASDIFLERRFSPVNSRVNPETGQLEGGLLWFTSTHNRLYIENIPVGYFPYISSPAEDPNIPLRSINFGYSTIFGAEVRTQWDVESLFSLSLPDGLSWRANVDYLSERGPGVGTTLKHFGAFNVFGMPVAAVGQSDFYYINDGGLDTLGADRINLPLESPHRGRAVSRYRFDLPFNTWIQSELGYLSDRNVREQYWENDWDSGKDYENLLQINRQTDNLTLSLMTRNRMFDFEYTTNWLPRGDATLLSQQVGNTPLLWSTHSSVGYAQLRPAEPPPDPTRDAFSPLPFVAERDGVVAMTRHELDLPLSLGPLNVVPYVLGEAAYWQEDLAGEELGRLYGSAGVRSSLMFSKYMPRVYSPILGLNGLAHKMVFDADYSYSESTESLGSVAQYNEFDEDAQERFRTRFLTLEYGGVLPSIYEPRNYAVRTGAGRNVTSPWHELVDDQHVVRLGWRHRLQTRVGNPQTPRIYDWMTLDLEASIFPNADRDNFGETVGLIGANYAWNIGPRTSLIANGLFDVFDEGQQVWNVGVLSSRIKRGSAYLGVRGIDAGPVDTALLIASVSYQPSDKWIATAGTAYDIIENLDRGQSFTVTRVGEYLLFVVGAGYDRSRNAWSFNFSIEPKIGNLRTGSLTSSQISSTTGLAP